MSPPQSSPGLLGFFLCAWLLPAFLSGAENLAPSLVLSEWNSPTVRAVGLRSAPRADGWVEFQAVPGAKSAVLVVAVPEGGLKIDDFSEVALPIRNLGPEPVRVTLVLDSAKTKAQSATALNRAVRAELALPTSGETFWLTVPLADSRPGSTSDLKWISLVRPPHEFTRHGTIGGAAIVAIRVVLLDVSDRARLALGRLVARGTPTPLRTLPPEHIFPLVDSFGQNRHREWPGKIRHEADLAAQLRAEEAALQSQTRPADRDRFGGWAAGPRRQATGFFRVEKIDGKWWMIDPDGRLFWSNGVVRVGTRVRVGGVYRGTPLPDREHYFTLPPRDSPLAAFFGTQPQATRGYYVGRPDHAVYDYLEANLFRKYGPRWSEAYAAQAQRRLASWGLNTIANSSDPEIYRRRETPYTAVVYSAPLGGNEYRLAGSTGNWGKLPDPFDPGWRELMRRTLTTELKDATRDPWCLGFFVDNELHWGDACHLAEATLASPAAQHAKRVFADDLRRKYSTIAALNQAWGTAHAGWEEWLAATKLPDRKRPAVRTDLEAFSEHYLEAYFRGCAAAVKAEAPNHLYLGCRFAGGAGEMVMRVAVRHCDVISINRYAHLVDDLALPAGLDRPIIIGEFHFGALDRGPLAAALTPVCDQNTRAVAYGLYLESALRNPRIVGAHWFQYYDQPTTGRFDGENYQTGLVDICDTPYPETIAAVRRTAASLYATRAAATP